MTRGAIPVARAVARTAGAVAVLTLSVLFASPVSAHAELVSSTPANGVTLTSAPADIALVFDDEVQPASSTVLVTVDDGDVVRTGPLRGESNQLLVPLLDRVITGRVTVAYRAVAADGHSSVGSITYTVAPQSGVASGVKTLVAAVVAMVALLLAGLELTFAVRRRRGRAPRPGNGPREERLQDVTVGGDTTPWGARH